MASSSTTTSEPSHPSPIEGGIDKNLQPFFVLHKALPLKPEKKDSKSGKPRRKIELSQSFHQSSEKSAALPPEEDVEQFYEQLRLQACNVAWSEIEGAIEVSLRQINLNIFEEVRRWVFDSFAEIKSTGSHSASRSLCPYPLVTDGICRQIFSAFILTTTFQELSAHLKSNGCHVANLSSLDFTSKHGITGCLRSLLRQLVMVTLDSYDIAVLASWYCEAENYDKPVVVVIDDLEQCSGPVLAEFISMLSEWIIKIPIILALGVATTIDAPRKLLPTEALRHLNSFRFTLASPSERLNVIVEGILAKPCLGFTIGHEVASFLRNYFSRQDGTITSLIRALKIACTKHYSMEPLSFLGHFVHGEERENAWVQICEALSITRLSYAFDHPSCQREKFCERSSSSLFQGLSDFRRLWKGWTSVLMLTDYIH
ncbi:hypothetical protein Taro_028080 [Colocasia esculenta]|uniref:Origin recognition complex subunit 3 N-terminal domain-containing protein n=1 Tax=Colocasia esculenta TaxID=4460 RepID=A0A843VT67_COLES|nr:hypothetical protein [Colocasia esculenta]